MARPTLTSRWPTCLACVRRLAQPSINSPSTSFSSSPLNITNGPGLVQTRAGSNYIRPQDKGVVVRLLEDVPKFGRKHAVFRTERGRMRNQWYPANKAEYMTRQRFRELGMTEEDVGERDRAYGVANPSEEEDGEESYGITEPGLNEGHLSAETARSLISSLVPETLTFYRKPITKPVPKASEPAAPTRPRISPLVSSAETATERNAKEATTTEGPGQDSTALGIYGSVSTLDIAHRIKEILAPDSEASRIALDSANIHIVGFDDSVQRLKTLGRWEIDISVGILGVGPKPVRKIIEILPPVEGQEISEPEA